MTLDRPDPMDVIDWDANDAAYDKWVRDQDVRFARVMMVIFTIIGLLVGLLVGRST